LWDEFLVGRGEEDGGCTTKFLELLADVALAAINVVVGAEFGGEVLL